MSNELGAWWVAFPAFLGSWAVHVIWWRWGTVRREFWALAILFIGGPLLGLGLGRSYYNVYAFALHVLLSANYLAIYPALQASSPTLVLLTRLYDVPRGLTREALIPEMKKAPLLAERWRDLERGGLITLDQTLSRRGRTLALFFIGYRRALGLGEGDG